MRDGRIESGGCCSTSPEILARFGAFFSEDPDSTGFRLMSFALLLENPQLKPALLKSESSARRRDLRLIVRIGDDLGGAEYGGQEFYNDPAVHDP
jgi:hypothetical protein